MGIKKDSTNLVTGSKEYGAIMTIHQKDGRYIAVTRGSDGGHAITEHATRREAIDDLKEFEGDFMTWLEAKLGGWGRR